MGRLKGLLSTRDVADLFDVDEWRVRRLFEDGTLPEPPRFAGRRVITGQVLASVVDALRSRNWLPSGVQHVYDAVQGVDVPDADDGG